jgi:hypothetical protein
MRTWDVCPDMNDNDDSDVNDLTPDDDARIDAMARAAGTELRRPAPPDGIARAQRSRRRRQAVRAGVTGTAVVALVGLGVVAMNARDDAGVVPATVASTDDTDTSVPSSAPATDPTVVAPSTTTAPASTAPSTTLSGPSAVGAPEVVYAITGSPYDAGATQTLIDPTDGTVVGSETVDGERSQAAQAALVGRSAMQPVYVNDASDPDLLRYEVTVGEIVYGHATLPSEIPTIDDQDPDALPFFDRCEQAELTVQGAAGSVLPARVRRFVVSADGRTMATLSGVCPEAGTLADGDQVFPFDVSLQVFDASRPDLAGTVLTDGLDAANTNSITFSPDGRFVAVETYTDEFGYEIFDLESGEQVDVTGGCTGFGTKWSRFIGPWIGASSVAIVLDCPEGRQLLVRDLASGQELSVDFPVAAENDDLEADVDFAHFDRPDTTWFTMCDFSAQQCWIGTGDRPLIEIPGVTEASFLPLGFTYGG